MEITISQAQGKVPVTVIRLKGNLDANSAGEVNEGAQKAIQGGAKDILLDLSKVDFMSSAGIRSITMLYEELNPAISEAEKAEISRGIRAGTYRALHLKLLNPSKRVVSVLQMAGLDMFLETFSNERKAISSF